MWFRYIALDIFLSGHIVSKNFKGFLHSLNEFQTDTKFTYELSKESIAFLDLKVKNSKIIKSSKIITNFHVKSTDHQQDLHYLSTHPNHTK